MPVLVPPIPPGGDLADAQPVAVALLALLNGWLDSISAQAYEYDDVAKMKALPNQYVEIMVSRRFGGELRVSAGKATVPYRLSLRVVARTVAGARELRRLCTALETETIAANGGMSTPIQFETEDDIGPDEGFYSGLTSWTFAL